MTIRLLVVFMTIWLVSTLALARLPWFQRREEGDQPDDRGDGVGLGDDAENWLLSQ